LSLLWSLRPVLSEGAPVFTPQGLQEQLSAQPEAGPSNGYQQQQQDVEGLAEYYQQALEMVSGRRVETSTAILISLSIAM
jgi:hypothetical protein